MFLKFTKPNLSDPALAILITPVPYYNRTVLDDRIKLLSCFSETARRFYLLRRPLRWKARLCHVRTSAGQESRKISFSLPHFSGEKLQRRLCHSSRCQQPQKCMGRWFDVCLELAEEPAISYLRQSYAIKLLAYTFPCSLSTLAIVSKKIWIEDGLDLTLNRRQTDKDLARLFTTPTLAIVLFAAEEVLSIATGVAKDLSAYDIGFSADTHTELDRMTGEKAALYSSSVKLGAQNEFREVVATCILLRCEETVRKRKSWVKLKSEAPEDGKRTQARSVGVAQKERWAESKSGLPSAVGEKVQEYRESTILFASISLNSTATVYITNSLEISWARKLKAWLIVKPGRKRHQKIFCEFNRPHLMCSASLVVTLELCLEQWVMCSWGRGSLSR